MLVVDFRVTMLSLKSSKAAKWSEAAIVLSKFFISEALFQLFLSFRKNEIHQQHLQNH